MRARIFIAFLGLVTPWVLSGQDEAFVRIELEPEIVSVGEPLTMKVSVFVPTWFKEPPTYPSFEIANAITRIPPDSSYPTNQRVNGANWSGIIRNYEIYPLVGASFQLSGLSLSLNYANPSSPAQGIEAVVPVPDIRFQAVVPNGAEALDPYLAGTRFSIERTIDNSLEDLKAGDARVFTFIARLEGLPSLFIPPIAQFPQREGMAVYPKNPEVTESDGVAMRTESVTVVFENGGTYEIPGQQYSWWNLDTQSLETVSMDPLLVAVEGPVIAPVEEDVSESFPWRRALL